MAGIQFSIQVGYSQPGRIADMLNLLERIMGKKSPEIKQVKCLCGEEVVGIPNDTREIYFCKKCNKLLCYSDFKPGLFKVRPLSLAWLKRKH